MKTNVSFLVYAWALEAASNGQCMAEMGAVRASLDFFTCTQRLEMGSVFLLALSRPSRDTGLQWCTAWNRGEAEAELELKVRSLFGG